MQAIHRLSINARAILIVAVAVIAALAWQQSASAAPSQESEGPDSTEGVQSHRSSSAECDTEAAGFQQVETVSDTGVWLDLAREGVAEGSIPLVKIDEVDLQWSGLQAIGNPDDGTTYVFIPAAKFNPDGSGLVLEYSRSQELNATIENHFALIGDDLIEFTNSVDGATVHTELIEESRFTSQGFSWSKFNSCLANQGISGFVITLIGIACTAAGGPAGIAACIFGLSYIAAGTAGYCVAQATTSSFTFSRATNAVAA